MTCCPVLCQYMQVRHRAAELFRSSATEDCTPSASATAHLQLQVLLQCAFPQAAVKRRCHEFLWQLDALRPRDELRLPHHKDD